MPAALTEKVVKATLAAAKAEVETHGRARERDVRGGSEMAGLTLRVTTAGNAYWYVYLGRALKRKLGVVSPSFPLSTAKAHAQRMRANYDLNGIRAAPTKRQVRRADLAMKAGMQVGMPAVEPSSPGLTMREFITKVYEPWLLSEAGDDPKLCRRVAQEIQRLTAPPMEPLLVRPLSAIDKDALVAWQASRLTQASRRGSNRKCDPKSPPPTVSKWTVKREVSTVKTLLKRARDHGFATGDTSGVPSVLRKVDRIVGNERVRVLTVEEFEALRKALAQPEYFDTDVRVAVLLAYYTGGRMRELLDLTWDHVDLEERPRVYFERTKSEKPRTVPLHPDAAVVLSEWQDVCTSDTYVFPHRDNSSKPRGQLKASWAALRSRIGADDLWFHDLRRTCATYLAESGAPVQHIARILGHAWGSEAAITSRYAKHMTAEAVRSTVDLLPSLLPKS